MAADLHFLALLIKEGSVLEDEKYETTKEEDIGEYL